MLQMMLQVVIKKIPFVLVILFLAALRPVYAQNLVPNGSFEEFLSCPGNYAVVAAEFRARDWFSASGGTPDQFHACSRGGAGVPHNWAGVSDAYDGDGYAGIFLWLNNPKNNYREYLQCRLTEPLIKDSTYRISFRYRLSSYSRYSVDRIGLLLSDSIVTIPGDQVLACNPTFQVLQDSALTQETGYWEKAFYTYRATGGEQYVVIGNFSDNQATEVYGLQFGDAPEEMLRVSSYYYIDNVMVEAAFPPPSDIVLPVLPEFMPEHVEMGKTYVLNHIQFEFDSYRLKHSSFETLDDLVHWLEEHPKVNVILSGHTDDVGGAGYNLTLSKNRAGSVAAYLVSRGIAQTRIERNGYGESRPVAEGTTEHARSLNRRVEVRFVE